MKSALILSALAATALAAPSLSFQGIKRVDKPLRTGDTSALPVLSGSQGTWTATDDHKFKDAHKDDIRAMCGAISPQSERLPEKETRPLLGLPDNFDSRTQWSNCSSIQHIRDQASCGSCWAFGSTEAFEDRLCIATGGSFNGLLSPQDTAFCCHEWTIPDFCGMGCNGGNPGGAWRYFHHTGIVTGGDFGDKTTCDPYTIAPCEHHVNGTRPACKEGGGSPSCSKKCTSSSGKSWKTDTHKAKSSYSVSSDESKIRTEILQNGPVTAAFTVYSDFPSYKTGVYQHKTGSALGGHAIKIIGWGVEDSTNYWLVANSWNTDWGDKGFFKILRGSNECGIEGDISAGLAA